MRSVDTEDRCTLGRYVKDAMRSVDTEDRCYKKSFVAKQVGLCINYIFRVTNFFGDIHIILRTYGLHVYVHVYVFTYACFYIYPLI